MKGGISALCILFTSCLTPVHADGFLAAGVAGVSSLEVQQQFHAQLRTMLGQGGASDVARLERLQSLLTPMYAAMPKSADGGLEHGTVRYALHRFFARQHGWHVRGLEASAAEEWRDAESSSSMLKDHIPSYVLQLFEQSRGGRTGLRELAVLAATLEDVVHGETIQLLSRAYVAQGRSEMDKLTASAEIRIVTTYLLFHLMPMPHFSSLTTTSLNRVIDHTQQIWTGWLGTVMFMQDLRDTMDYHESPRQNPFLRKQVSRQKDFNSLVRLLESVGEHYGQFQDLECREIKNALLDLSDGSGRVRLASFYQAALENRTTHFTESSDYLRHLGALDETDPRQSSLIVTNYMYARANCMASSSLYSICCIDECEALMAQLERSIANPVAVPAKVAELVAGMPSDTVAAPRNISAPMLRRLDEIARRHGGSVPLHGRLFAQWMHHAFPNECSYPHMTGSLEAPVNPIDLVLAETEEQRAAFRLKATKEEMQEFVDAALSLNASDPLAAAQEPLLPWTEEEELMGGGLDAHPMGKAGPWLRRVSLVASISSVAFGLLRMLYPSKAEKGQGRSLSTMLSRTWAQDNHCV